MKSYTTVTAAERLFKQQYMKTATPAQKKAIKYFVPDGGCIGLFGRVKDEEYDRIVESIVNSIGSYNRALEKIGVDGSELNEISPITLYGYEASEFSKVNIRGEYRSNLYSVTHLFFSATQVYMYKIIFNTLKNDWTEITEEYFYRDITNISTSVEVTESLMYKGCRCGACRVSVEIQRFSLTVPGDRFSCATYGDINNTVLAMKNKIREKKYY